MTRWLPTVVLLIAFPATTAEPLRVIDGDTFFTPELGKVRLWGIDAPERGRPCYLAAKHHLRAFLNHRSHRLRCLKRGTSHDRVVMSCVIDGADPARSLVMAGLAIDWPKYSGGHYADAMKFARGAGVGIWGDRCDRLDVREDVK